MKKRYNLIIYFVISTIFFTSFLKGRETFIYPIPIDIRIKSIFASFRGNHFHGGIDFSTFGKIGIPVRAVENGYIFRLSNKFYGFGNAVYIKHKTFISVYGHLDRFENKVLKLGNLAKRLANKTDGRYFGDYFFKNKGIFVKKGQIIAYSGETGAGPPHLHFEIRDLNNNPINTFNYIKIQDTISPRIGKVILKPLRFGAFINGKLSPEIIKLNGKQQNKYPVYISGPFSITITSWDKYYKYDRTGIYGWRCYIDKTLLSEIKFDKIPFYKSHQIALIYDINKSSYKKDYFFYNVYPYYGSGLGKMAIAPKQLFEKLKIGKHILKIEVFDFWGNKTVKEVEFIKTDNRLPVINKITKISPVKFIIGFVSKINNPEIEIKGDEEKIFHSIKYKKLQDNKIEIVIPRPFDGLNYSLRVRQGKYTPWTFKKFKTLKLNIDGFQIERYKNRLKIDSMKKGFWEFGKRKGKLKRGLFFLPYYNGILRLRFKNSYYSFVFRKNGIKHKKEFILLKDDIVKMSKDYLKDSIYYGNYFYKRIKPDFKRFFFIKKGENKTIDLGDYKLLFYKDSLYKDFIFERTKKDYPFEPQLFPLRKPLTILPDNFPFKKKLVLKAKLTDYNFKKRVGIFRYDIMAGRWTLVGDRIQNGFIFSKIWLGGTYALMADEYPPELKFYFPKNGRTYKRIINAVAIIRDKGKGIDYHKTFFKINGKKLWAIYDPDKASMYYPISKFIKPGKNRLTAIVTDYAGNTSIKHIMFYKISKHRKR